MKINNQIRLIFICLLIIMNGLFIFAEREKNKSEFLKLNEPYLGQKPPGLIPEIFAPGIILTIHQEHSSLAFSPDGQKLYFYSRRPHKKGGKSEKYLDIWMVRRVKSGWSEALLMPSPINSELNDASPFIGTGGTFYLSRKIEDLPYNNIFQFKFKNGKYSKGENISTNINKKDARESSFTIAKDGSFIIFTSDNRKFAKGKRISGDRNLMVSFKDKNGEWGKAINTGKIFNKKKARFPSLSLDGKYLFFTRYDKKGNEDFYWVDVKIIEKLK